MHNPRGPIGRVHKAMVAGTAVVAVGMTGCGSSAPKSGSAATTAAPTTAAAVTTAPAAATTMAPTTTVAASTTTAATTVPTSTAPTGKDAKAARRYKTIIDGANAAGTKFAPALDGYQAGTVTSARLKPALRAYIAASRKLQTSLLAVRWPAAVEKLVHRIVTEDKRLVTQIRPLATTPRAELKAALTKVTNTLIEIHALSDQIRKDLGLPEAK